MDFIGNPNFSLTEGPIQTPCLKPVARAFQGLQRRIRSKGSFKRHGSLDTSELPTPLVANPH